MFSIVYLTEDVVTARYVTFVPLGVGVGGVAPGARGFVGEGATVAASSSLAAIHSVNVVIFVHRAFDVRTVTCPSVAVESHLGLI